MSSTTKKEGLYKFILNTVLISVTLSWVIILLAAIARLTRWAFNF